MLRNLFPADSANEVAPISDMQRVQRTSLACDGCRVRKVKCSGQKPCRGCEEIGQSCFYRPIKYMRRAARRRSPSRRCAKPESLRSLGSREGPPTIDKPIQLKTHRELRAGIGVSHPQTGPSSHFCFIQRIYQRLKSRTNETLLVPPTGSVPDGVGKWGLERFVFSVGAAKENSSSFPDCQAYPSPDMSLRYIDAYFDTAHPQMPILCQCEIIQTWEQLCQPPSRDRAVSKGYEVVLLVLAIGAQISSSDEGADSILSQQWAGYFYSRTQAITSVYEEPGLRSTQFLILKAFYAFLVMRPNDAYLALGHATRNAIALGIDRQQVVDGSSFTIHRLRVTFWTLYAMERSSCLFTGRQSALRDDQIDVSYPEDWPLGILRGEGSKTPEYFLPLASCGWVRAMAQLGSVADRILAGIYSPNSMTNHADIFNALKTVSKCDSELTVILKSLPSYLHFFDTRLPICESWQEMQRISLGLSYYQTRMLMHRPSLILASFYESGAEILKFSEMATDLAGSIEATLLSARQIIELAHDVYFHRYPKSRLAGNLATFLIFACITLLYNVLGPGTTPECAMETFALVERGIQCIDQIQHVGPTTGKAVSLDIMRAAKEALMTTESDIRLNENLINDFPWLHNLFHMDSEMGSTLGSIGPRAVVDEDDSSVSDCQNSQPTSTVFPSLDLNYMSHWLEAGFDPAEIPNCLF